jgi:2-oxoisovalerate dehydrogenase E1 component
MFNSVKKHNRCLLVTEESCEASFTLGLAARIQENCFQYLDAPIMTIGSIDTPAIPLNSILESTLLPNAEKVGEKIKKLLSY